MIWQYVLTYYKWPTTLTSIVLRVHLFPYVCKFVCVCIWRTLLRFIRFDIAGIYVLILCCLAIRCHLSPNIWLPFSPGTC